VFVEENRRHISITGPSMVRISWRKRSHAVLPLPRLSERRIGFAASLFFLFADNNEPEDTLPIYHSRAASCSLHSLQRKMVSIPM
jgi:hypothetical protein